MDELERRNGQAQPTARPPFQPTNLEVLRFQRPNPNANYPSTPNQNQQAEPKCAWIQNHPHRLRLLQSEFEREHVAVSCWFRKSPHNVFALLHTSHVQRCDLHPLISIVHYLIVQDGLSCQNRSLKMDQSRSLKPMFDLHKRVLSPRRQVQLKAALKSSPY